jgi:four helix bundle protein
MTTLMSEWNTEALIDASSHFDCSADVVEMASSKSQIKDQIPSFKMDDGAKPRDLEDRTFEFAQSVRAFVKQLPRTVSNTEDVKQLVRASGSVAANWIEADEALSKKDFLMRVKICRKEAKESRLFLRLVDAGFAKSNVVARDFSNRGAGADPNFFVDYLEKRIIARCPFWD